jgi:phosphoesterase RecJ-like protein
MMEKHLPEIEAIINNCKKVLIIQADNPDADSLGSALALEEIFENKGIKTALYCSIDVPDYLRYLPGWDRVEHTIPRDFDASIIVDASTTTLLERILKDPIKKNWLNAKPCIVLDHHAVVNNPIPFATVEITEATMSSSGELIYHVAKALNWDVPLAAQKCIMASILGDTQGLTNQLAGAPTYRVMAEMIEAGVSRPDLEESRRQLGKMVPEIYAYKAALINRTTFSDEGRIADVVIPQNEISTYSPLYNPAPLILSDMLQVSDVLVGIVMKKYDDGKITAAIRCNPGAPIAGELAQHFGGGGHAYASGFKYTSSREFSDIREECMRLAAELLATKRVNNDQAVQYSF